MTSLLLSAVAFFVASYFIRRYLDRIDAPPGMTRNILIFCAAIMISYAVAWVIDRIVS